MPDTGAPWNIPYVAASDLVKDWPTDNQEQAEAIADALSAVLVKSGYVTKIDTQSSALAAGGSTAVSGLTIAHALSDSSNDVYLFASIGINNSAVGQAGIAITAGGTALNLGTDPTTGQLPVASSIAFGADVDVAHAVAIAKYQPGSTSSVTYGVDIYNTRASGATVYVNRSGSDNTNERYVRTSSTLLLVEVRP